MGTFAASLRALGDVTGVRATVELEGGQMTIAAGSTDIGSWALDEVHFEPIPTGYRVGIEGEQILIELEDRDSFEEELNSRRRRRRKDKKKKDTAAEASAPKQSPEPPTRTATATKRRVTPADYGKAEPNREPKKRKERPPKTDDGVSKIDQLLSRAEKRLGAYLPEWVFTRGTLGMSAAALTLMIIFPGLTSIVLLVAGALVVMLGAVIYTDPMLAPKWLPGAMGPQHVLITGVAVLLLGVIVGMFSS